MSENRTINDNYVGIYTFKNDNQWDYSITMKVVPSVETKMQCYVVYGDGGIEYSSWSNISLTGKYAKYFASQSK